MPTNSTATTYLNKRKAILTEKADEIEAELREINEALNAVQIKTEPSSDNGVKLQEEFNGIQTVFPTFYAWLKTFLKNHCAAVLKTGDHQGEICFRNVRKTPCCYHGDTDWGEWEPVEGGSVQQLE